MKRRMIPMLLTAAMIASSLSVSAFAAPFGDTNGHWGQKAIERWSGHGIVKGADGKFRPDDSLTRGELATIVSNLLKLSDMPAGNPFTDLDQNWYTDSILKCFEAGIMNGDGNTVRPNDPVTREEAMVILSNALRIAPKAGDVTGFDDAHMVSNWAEGAVNALLDSGVVNGVDADTLAPQGLINRASVVTILNNAIGNYVSEDGASIEANGGMVLVVGGDVTITGEADSVLILGGDKEVVMEDLKVEGDVLVEGADTKVVLNGETEVSNVTVAENAAGAAVEVGENASAGEVTVDAPAAEVSVAGQADSVTVTGEETKVEVSGTVDVVAVGEAAANTEVTVTKDAEVGTLTTEAEKTEVTVQGTVSDVKVSETADETSVKVESTGKVDTVDTAASDVSVSGKGEVSNVEASGDNTSVSTNGTKVEAAEGTTGVTAGNKDVAAGESATTSKPSSGGGGGSSSSSKPSHSHSYTAGTVVENGVEYNTCSCGAKEATGRVFVDTEEELATALAAGGEVVLGKDILVETMIEIPADVTVTLDLNGYDITSAYNESTEKHIYPLSNCGTMTIKDTEGNGSISGRGIYNQDGAKLTVNDAEIVAEDWNGGAGIWSYGTGKVYLNDATITGNTGVVSSEGYLEINGGTYTCYSGIKDDGTIGSPTYNIRAYNGLKITDGTFTSRHGVISVGGGESVIEDGSFTIKYAAATTSNVVYVYGNADMTINGGEFISDDSADKADSGAAVLVNGSNAKVTINEGTFVGLNGMVSGNATLYGGTFNTVWDYNHYDKIKDKLAEGYEATQNEDGSWTVKANVIDTAEELATALAAGGTVELGGTITVSEELEITKDVIINGNGHDIESSASRVFQLRASDIEVTMNDLDMVSTAERVGTNNIRGINIDNNNYSGIVLTLNDCSFDFADESASDWSYAINVTGNNTGHTINIDGGSYEGANVINVWGNNHKITVENATLTSLYAYNSMYCGVCIKLEGTGIILNTSENTFNGDHALPIGFGENANDIQTSEDDNKNNTTVQVKDFDGLKRLAESHDCSIVAQMQNDIEADEVLVITNDSKFTIDGNGHKLTSSANRAINVNTAGEPVIKNLTILNEGSTYSYDDVRAINVIQKATNLTLKNVTADGFKYTINVAGSSVGSTIDIIGGKYTGYAALNITGSNTKVNVEDAVLASVNDASKHASNAFGTISVGDITADTAINNVIVTVDGGTLEAESEGNRQFLVTVQNAEAVTVNIKADQYIIENNDVFCIGSEDCSFYIEGVDCENTEVGGVHYGTMKPETVESTSEKSSETTNDESEQSDEGSEGNESAGSEEA